METTDNFDDSWLCRNGSFERTQIDIVREQWSNDGVYFGG